MKEKLTDLIISGLLKRGILWEAKAIDTDIEVPIVVEDKEGQPKEKIVKINIKCDNMSIRIDKE